VSGVLGKNYLIKLLNLINIMIKMIFIKQLLLIKQKTLTIPFFIFLKSLLALKGRNIKILSSLKNKIKFLSLIIKERWSYKIKYYSLIIKDKLYQFIFGQRVGSYHKDHLCFPIIVLNNTVLLEFIDKEESIQPFFHEKLGDDILINFSKEKTSIFNLKLLELIEKEGNKPFPYDFKNLEHPRFSDDFTLNIYKEWKENPEFLLYVFSYYFNNFLIYFFNEIEEENIRNHLIKIDISFLFIYQEQANYIADRLSNIFKDELTPEAIEKYRFPAWLSSLIKNLYKVDLPYINLEKNTFNLKKKLKVFFLALY
jgi:hypothetical protein